MTTIQTEAIIGKGGLLHVEGLPIVEGTAVSIEVRPQSAPSCLTPPRRSGDLSKFIGSLTLTEDPLEYQRRMREEWDDRS